MRIRDMIKALPHKNEQAGSKTPKRLFTEWGRALDPSCVWTEYPRPQMVRDSFVTLNGYWSYAITGSLKRPSHFDGKILVPFSPESALSGVNRQLMPDEYLWYERQVQVPAACAACRYLLHFEAVDQHAVVYINGKKAVSHTGGYLPFTVDITHFLSPGETDFTLTVLVQDFSDTSYHSRGKQKLQPGGMYYTAQSGIWQSVWMETVPDSYIEDILVRPFPSLNGIHVTLQEGGGSGSSGHRPVSMYVFAPTCHFDAAVKYAGTPIAAIEAAAMSFDLNIPDPHLWSPDTPWLYPVEIRLGQDCVRSYFALRRISMGADAKGITRIFLNNAPIFLNGVLDQGYWPDGLYTAPADKALIYDITTMKTLGFNMLRKHAKIENRRWYYHCDRIGMLVWQDMVNGGGTYSALLLTYLPTALCVPGALMKKRPRHTAKSERPSFTEYLEYHITGRTDRRGRNAFKKECAQTIRLLQNHPCVMTWVIFNEGWGQFETAALTDMVRTLDPDRLIDAASGWFEHKTGDIKSIHNYFRKLRVPQDIRAVVLSEYGGSVCHIDGHSMFEQTYGYHTCHSTEEFENDLVRLFTEEIAPLIPAGLCGAVYTQLSDIEEETNGLLTYDRKICKLSDAGAIRVQKKRRSILIKMG